MKPICIIPARGGSKRIPRKNIRKFNKKPIIYWPILAAKNTSYIDQIIVSTDDKEIAENICFNMISKGYSPCATFKTIKSMYKWNEKIVSYKKN